MKTLIALYGKSASGKDTILRELGTKMGTILAITTRPPRQTERNGVHYLFMSNTSFEQSNASGDMICVTEFNNWHYAISKTHLNQLFYYHKMVAGVFNNQSLPMIEEYCKENNIIFKPIEIYAPDKERLIRSLNREYNPDCKEIIRRFLAEEEEYKEIDKDKDHTRIDTTKLTPPQISDIIYYGCELLK